MRNLMNVLVVVALFAILSTGSVAFAAGGPTPVAPVDGNRLGGTNSVGDVMMYSNSNSSDNYVSASFSLSMDADEYSLDYANWSLSTDYYDPSRWSATCNLHGKRNIAEECPQRQYWSQFCNTDTVKTAASLSLDCYSYNTHSSEISSLLAQVAAMKDYLTANPNADDAQKVSLQILLLQVKIGSLQQDNENVMGVSGSFEIWPSELSSSDFRYWNTTDYSYSYPNGYDQDPVITEIPTWNAQYQMWGHFVAPTLAEAQAMGAPFVQTQSVPEPSAFALMFGAVAVATLRRRRR